MRRNFICPETEEPCERGDCTIHSCAATVEYQTLIKTNAAEKLQEACDDLLIELKLINKMTRSSKIRVLESIRKDTEKIASLLK